MGHQGLRSRENGPLEQEKPVQLVEGSAAGGNLLLPWSPLRFARRKVWRVNGGVERVAWPSLAKTVCVTAKVAAAEVKTAQNRDGH